MQSSYQRLTDAQWEFIKHFLDWQRKRKLDLQEVFDATLLVTRQASNGEIYQRLIFPIGKRFITTLISGRKLEQ